MAHAPLRKPVDFTSSAGVPQTGAKCSSTNFYMAAMRASNSTPIGVLALLKHAILGTRFLYENGCMDDLSGMDSFLPMQYFWFVFCDAVYPIRNAGTAGMHKPRRSEGYEMVERTAEAPCVL